jgi:hypothetical protein
MLDGGNAKLKLRRDDRREHPNFVQILGKRYFLQLRVKYLDIPNFQRSGLLINEPEDRKKKD